MLRLGHQLLDGGGGGARDVEPRPVDQLLHAVGAGVGLGGEVEVGFIGAEMPSERIEFNKYVTGTGRVRSS